MWEDGKRSAPPQFLDAGGGSRVVAGRGVFAYTGATSGKLSRARAGTGSAAVFGASRLDAGAGACTAGLKMVQCDAAHAPCHTHGG